MAEGIRGVLIDNYGRPISGVAVTVKKMGTSDLAALYSDEALTASVGNPIMSETDGSYLAFVANGKYDVTFVKSGYTFDATDSVAEHIFDQQIVKTVSSSPYNLSENDYVVLVDATAGAITINLPAIAGIGAGRAWVVIKVDSSANAVTLDPNAAETINGNATQVISGRQGVQFAKGSTEWVSYAPLASLTAAIGATPLGGAGDGKLDSSWAGIVGEIKMYGGVSAPSGYLFCDGAAISRATYASLFSAIADVYGAGDGSTTFNVPDMRGRVPVGVGTGTGGSVSGTGLPTGGFALTAIARASWKGEETHTLAGGEVGAHSHAIPGYPHTHTIPSSGMYGVNGGDTLVTTAAGSGQTTGGGGASGTNPNAAPTPANVMQPVMGVNFIIKY